MKIKNQKRKGEKMKIFRLIMAVAIAGLLQFININPAAAQSLPLVPYGGTAGVSFDDGDAVTYQNASEVLNSRGIKATFFIIPDRIGTSGYMTWAQVANLVANHHEMGEHGPHVDWTTLSSSALKTQLTNAKSLIESKLKTSGVKVKTCAYPFGAYNTTVQSAVASLFESACAVAWEGDEPYNSFPSSHYAVARMKVHMNTTPEEAIAWINDARQKGQFPDLLFHDIVTGTPSVDEEYPMADFITIMNYIAGQKIPTLTISQALTYKVGPNQIKNPGFDTVQSSWPTNWHKYGNAAKVSAVSVGSSNGKIFSPYPGRRLQILGSATENGVSTDEVPLPGLDRPLAERNYAFQLYAEISISGGRFGIWIDEFDQNGKYLRGKEIGGFTKSAVDYTGFTYQPSSDQVKSIAVNLYSEAGTSGTGLFDTCYFGLIN